MYDLPGLWLTGFGVLHCSDKICSSDSETMLSPCAASNP